jgi:hypothetical protein
MIDEVLHEEMDERSRELPTGGSDY